MVAAFTKKNTLEQTGFALTDTGFHYTGIAYRFEDVVAVRSYRMVHELKTIGVGSDSTHAISILFILKDGENVQVTEQPTWTSSSKEDKVEMLQTAFDLVCKHTFQQRVTKYTNQIQLHGYFEYSGWRFFPDQQKVIDVGTSKAYPIQGTQFLRSYGFIEVKGSAEGFGQKMLKQITGKRIGIGTLDDPDVFFALLAHYFKLSWK